VHAYRRRGIPSNPSCSIGRVLAISSASAGSRR
jgi:hypothetical protein